MGLSTDLEAVVAAHFPRHLAPHRAFDDWFQPIIELVQPGALDLVHVLKHRLTTERRALQAEEGLERDAWSVFGEHPFTKSPDSVRSKLGRNLLDGPGSGRLSEAALERRVLALSDLARCRVVCSLALDVRRLLRVLLQGEEFLGAYRLDAPVKDYVYVPALRRVLRGHRARQFSVEVPTLDGRTFHFEIQLMTTLQHAWDRRNHPLYEQTREGEPLSARLQVDDFSCAETLHVVDQQADRNWERFLAERGGEHD